MGGARAHGASAADEVEVSVRARVVLLAALLAGAIGTVAGLLALWPDSGQVEEATASVEFAAPGVTFPHAEVRAVLPACAPTLPPPGETLDDASA